MEDFLVCCQPFHWVNSFLACFTLLLLHCKAVSSLLQIKQKQNHVRLLQSVQNLVLWSAMPGSKNEKKSEKFASFKFLSSSSTSSQELQCQIQSHSHQTSISQVLLYPLKRANSRINKQGWAVHNLMKLTLKISKNFDSTF